ncbi:MAG: hypothetical protein IJ692_02790 [Alloprevotella sp.]|nr:hypothetical protein [Alloprevotella sp.]MBR1652300.1 hypothetical protein [Alloprevotella sp.]
MKKMNYKASLLVLTMLLCGCSQRLVDFTVISTQNVPLTERGEVLLKANMRVEGSDTKWQVLFVPGIPSMKEAIDRAIRKYNGAVALADGVVYSKAWSIGLFGQSTYTVEGTPLYPLHSGEGVTTTPVEYQRNGNGNNNQQVQYHQNDTRHAQTQTQTQTQTQIETQQQPEVSTQRVMRVTHIVEGEKNVSELAMMYEVSVSDILTWNQMNTTSLKKGQKVIIYLPYVE